MFIFFFQAEDGIRDYKVTGVQTCALPILMRGIGLSRFRTRMLSCARWQRPLMVPVYALNDSRRILRQLLKYGPQIWTEAVPVGEMALYCYSLVSPVFWLCEKVKSFWPHHAAGQGAAQLTIQDLHV